MNSARKSNKKFEYSYGADDNSVNISSLLVSQLHFTTIINEVSKTIHPEAEIKIRVIAPKEGSLIFQQIIDCVVTSDIFYQNNLDYLANIFEVVGGVIMLKKWLGGKKPDKEQIDESKNSVNIEFNGKNKDVSINIYNIYTKDKVVNSAITKAFEAIESDEEISSLSIKEGNTTIANIEKSDFNLLISPNEYLDEETQEEVKTQVRLFVKNPDLIPKNKTVKWDFLYEGITKIKATITDKKFLSDISNTVYRLGAYDSLLADVKVISKFNEDAKIHLPHSYEVVRVHKVIYRISPKQKELFEGQ